MPTIQERKRAFRSRVFHAIKLIVASDTVEAKRRYFSGDDTDFLLTAIIRRAEKDEDLRNAICSAFAASWHAVCWHEAAERNTHLSDSDLAQAAAHAEAEADWYLHHVEVPQMVARLDPECRPFSIIRTEGDWVHTETYEASCLRDAAKAIRLWDRRSIRGVPFLSMFAKIVIHDPADGSSFTL